MQVREVLETCLCVDDLPAAEQFYTAVLGLQLHSQQPGRHLFFRCGNRMLLLFDPRQSTLPHGVVPAHGTHGPGHVCFAVREADLAAWREHLTNCQVVIESEVDWPQGGRSLYFRDPAGNSLELATPKIWGIGETTLPGF